jgi:hypothetical protein
MALKNSFLSSDGQQIHKYHQNKLGTSTQKHKKKTTIYDSGKTISSILHNSIEIGSL